MEDINEDIKVAALHSAARAIISHNEELSAHLDRGVAVFSESPPISERLKCESNGAHKFIEDFATALKALPRGCGPVQLAMTEVRVSCIDLVLKIRETEKLLPPSVTEADRRAFLDRIELVVNEETIFANLAVGVSGAAPDCPHRQYCRRIDNSVNSIKKQLTQLNIAIQHIERDIRQAANPADPPPETRKKARKKRRAKPHVTKSDLHAAVKTILRGEDVNAAKPGPRLTQAKRRQIAAAENYRATHRGCTLHNACLRSFVAAKGGYGSAKAMYECLRRHT
jgi:hypothetical protein